MGEVPAGLEPSAQSESKLLLALGGRTFCPPIGEYSSFGGSGTR